MPESIPPGPLSAPSARMLTRALARLAGLLRLRTTPPLALTWAEDQPLIYLAGDVGGGGEDGSFWAALVTKSGSTCPSYTFRRVTPTGTACGWTVDDTGAEPEGPLYEANACDLPINDPVVDDPDQFIVVRARPGAGAYWVFEEASRWEFVKTTSSTPDAGTGYFPGVILTFSTGGSTVDAEVIWVWDLNATP